MITILDSAYTYFLEGIKYQSFKLRIDLIEGFVGSEPETIQLANDFSLGDNYAIKPTDKSRHFSILFEHPVAWQVVDESFRCFNESEIMDTIGFLRVMQNTEYYEYVKNKHGWFEDVIGPAKHYRLHLENEIIDVISCYEPEIIEIKG